MVDVIVNDKKLKITEISFDILRLDPHYAEVTKLSDPCPVFKSVTPHHVDETNAVSILSEASHCIGERAAERDTESERSMEATVNAFNAMFGTNLTEVQGWQFMELLKMSRSRGGKFRLDDFVDGAAYAALAGETAGKQEGVK